MAKNIIVTTGGSERLPATVTLYKDAFRNDPALAYFMNSVNEAQRTEYRPAVFRVFLTAGALNEGLFFHAARAEDHDNPEQNGEQVSQGCRALVLKPGKNIDGPITAIRAVFAGSWQLIKFFPGIIYRIFLDTEVQIKRIRKKTFRPGEKWYYVASIATDERDRGKGLSSAVIRSVQGRARAEGASIWLEASTAHSRQIYAKLGFELIEGFVVGRGSVGANGLREKGGSGVSLWGMIWRPDNKSD